MYADKLNKFENAENLAGKAWQHAVNCDLLEQVKFKDCSMHCFHYQQLFEFLFKYLLEAHSEFGAYPHTHKLDRLLMQIVKDTEFRVDVEKYTSALVTLTVCAEAYRYNFLLNCETYKNTVKNLNPLLDELAKFVND